LVSESLTTPTDVRRPPTHPQTQEPLVVGTADLVGLSGEVVGVDRERTAIERANALVRLRGMRNVNFVEGDPEKMEFGQQFDAIVGRLVLMYYPDPVDTIRKLARHIRPGGLIVFQELARRGERPLGARRASLRARSGVVAADAKCYR